MSRFEDGPNRKASEKYGASERYGMSEKFRRRVDEVLESLPEKRPKRKKAALCLSTVIACAVFCLLVVAPNVSTAYAESACGIPVIGDIIKVFTVRSYFSGDHEKIDLNVPEVSDPNGGAQDINGDISKLTEAALEEFCKDIDPDADSDGNGIYRTLKVDYEVVMNTDRWFTLKVTFCTTAGSSDNYYRYYHIDRRADKRVVLGNMFGSADFGSVITEDIKRQMREQMAADDSVMYWLDKEKYSFDFADVGVDHNFYFNAGGDLVIPFDKYEVAPGAMGTPEFVVGRSVFEGMLKDDYKDICKR